MTCPMSRFPIGVIVFDELELILYVSQGLTLSTASLVLNIYSCLILHNILYIVRKQENGKNQLEILGTYLSAFNSPRLGF